MYQTGGRLGVKISRPQFAHVPRACQGIHAPHPHLHTIMSLMGWQQQAHLPRQSTVLSPTLAAAFIIFRLKRFLSLSKPITCFGYICKKHDSKSSLKGGFPRTVDSFRGWIAQVLSLPWDPFVQTASSLQTL